MIEISAGEIAAATRGRLVGLDPAATVTGPVVTDSRQVVPGALFAALPGEHADGHDFAAAAGAAGARAVIATREVTDDQGAPLPAVVVEDVATALGDLAREVLARLRPGGIRVAAVTGSVGKTTTKDLLLQLLGPSGPTVAPVASFNNEIGLPLTVLRADRATEFLVLEMGASALGELTYLTSIAPPDVAAVLRVAHAHVAGFGGIEQVAQAKSELVRGLAPGGVAVLNADDARVAAMAGLAGRVVLFGQGSEAEVGAEGIRLGADGRAEFTLVAGTSGQPGSPASVPVRLGLVGAHHVTNALAAAAVALELGIPLAQIAERLAGAGALSPHRMHLVDRADGVTILDDSYNANPDSMRAALQALAQLAGRGRRSVAVLGEMLELGEESREAHDAVGRLVVRLNVGWTVVVGAGAMAIRDGAAHEGSWGDEAVGVADIDEAEALLAEGLRPGDVVLVKSSYGAGLWRLADRLTAGQADA